MKQARWETAVLEIHEIKSSSPSELELLRRFSSECFKPSFPGDDERDIEAYFHRSQRGEFGADVPHLIVAAEDGVPVGGCICVYLAEPNAGFIEYVVVRESHRGGSGLITPMYTLAGQLFDEDAGRRGLELAMIVDEMEDPFRTPLPTWTKVDRFRRVAMAYHGGYKMLDFPYVQRNLQVPGQTGVHTLMLMAVPCSPEFEKSIPARQVRSLVQSCFNWDGRDESEGPTSYRGVLQSIMDYLPPGDEPVPLFDLGDYVCCDEETAPIQVEEISERPASGFGDAPDPLVADWGHPHLWSIRTRAGSAPAALASFASTPTVGFGRYLGLAPAALDQRAVGYLCSRIEKQMIQDGNLSLGWYVQCPGAAERDALLRHPVGFYELDVPFTPIESDGPAFLLYKPYGRPHRAPVITATDFLASMNEIGAPAWSRLEESLAGLEFVPFKSTQRLEAIP